MKLSRVTEVAKQSGVTQDICTVGLSIATTNDMQNGDQQQEAEAKRPGRFHAEAKTSSRVGASDRADDARGGSQHAVRFPQCGPNLLSLSLSPVD